MLKSNGNLMIFILTIGVFSIINTEMGVIGILPLLAERFGVSIPQAGLLISLFASGVLFAGVFRCRCFRTEKRPVKSCCQSYCRRFGRYGAGSAHKQLCGGQFFA